MIQIRFLVLFCIASILSDKACLAQSEIPDGMHLLRSGESREWDVYPEGEFSNTWETSFEWEGESTRSTVVLSQWNVKQGWQVEINGEKIALLHRDENRMKVYWEIPEGVLKKGENRLTIRSTGSASRGGDDVVVGRAAVLSRSLEELLNEARLTVSVTDAVSDKRLPARLTILNSNGELQSVGAVSDDHLAVRPGTVYTSTGEATFGLPVGKYTIFAGRGFEYSLAQTEVSVSKGDKSLLQLKIERQVDTKGYVACDTHVHTLTHSGHGDSSVQERMITLAAEGIELPIATDHNVQIDHQPFAEEMNVSNYFTPVIGNEYTTRVGHFNIFPIAAKEEIPNYRFDNWSEIFEELKQSVDPPVIILNHARDVHSGYTPFGPKNQLAIVGENLHGWPIGFNAMEVINSGATQTDPMELFRDWMHLLNAGHEITPVGSSDSHDVSRHFVGQGRTYIRCADQEVGAINIPQAVAAFRDEEVIVSYGLFAQLKFTEDEEVPEQIVLDVNVQHPDWTTADRIDLYANGKLVESITADSAVHQKRTTTTWNVRLKRSRPRHDTIFVAIASGPGVEMPYWRTALPYQPRSESSKTIVLGCSGARRFHADGHQEFMCAKDYASQTFAAAKGRLPKANELFVEAQHDSAVANHLAHMYVRQGGSVETEEFKQVMRSAYLPLREGFAEYRAAWLETQLAQGQP